ncbi:MAG: cytochrome c oxidase assembly protein [Acidimicrobiia bacterium]
MTWWCAATRLPWSWAPRAYPGVWLFVAALALGGWTVARRSGLHPTRRQRLSWWGGLAALWVASDWPVGTLGSGYLASAHMLQYLLYTFVAAPLLLLAVPEPLADALVARAGIGRVARALARPVVAGAVVNVVLVVTHAPITVDALRADQLGSFLLDVAWLAGGLVLWLPVCGPVPALRPSYPARGIYLFLAAGLIPMVPGGFLTFADFPLYRIYELAPRVGSIDPTADQQLAGVLMKVGNVPLIWPVIGAMFWRWSQQETSGSRTGIGSGRSQAPRAQGPGAAP